MEHSAKIFVAGHKGMVGSAIVRKLETSGYSNIIVAERSDLDLRDESAVKKFFVHQAPDYVFLAAARVGGIQANMDSPAEFLIENLRIQNNVIYSALETRVKKFCFLGSSCIYPGNCPQPIKEEYLLSGPLEPTNEGYAIAKIAGLRLVQYLEKQYGFLGINPMPCNIYGKNDSFDLQKSHVLSALTRRFSDAVSAGLDEVTLWGTGEARREFLNVNDRHCVR